MGVEQFVARFHSLSGKTIGEKLKSLNHLTRDIRSTCSQEDVDQFIAAVKPANNFEKLLKGRLIDTFKKTRDVVDVLKCEDRLFIKQVLGCDWFFEGSSTDFPTCEFFFTDVFPNTSFNTRNDIIHSLSVHLRDERVAEQFFSAVRSEYGLQQAKCLLCACRAHFVQSVLDTDGARLDFTEREVTRLVRKFPNLVKANMKKWCFASCMETIIKLMCDLDVKLFIECFQMIKRRLIFKIGRRGIKKIIRFDPASIIKSASKYIDVTEPKYLHKYMTAEDFTYFYRALFPNSYQCQFFFSECPEGNFYKVVEPLNPRKRLDLMLSSFEKVYGEQLLALPDLVGEKLLQMLPADKRETCAQLKIELCLSKDEDETLWICYLPTGKSVPTLKKLLLQAPDLDQRCRLISYLILTCKVNEDLETLASVCKHIVARYRNDNLSLRIEILRELYKNFDFLKLDDRLWASVQEVVKVIFLNAEHLPRRWPLFEVLIKSVHFRLNNHVDIHEQIDHLVLILSSSHESHNNWVIIKEEPKYQQTVFEVFGERIPHVKGVNVPLTSLALSLLSSVSDWNKNNKLFQSSLSRFSWVVEGLKRIVETNLDDNKNKVLELLKTDLETKQLVCSDDLCREVVSKDLWYFLKMDTEMFIQNAHQELEFLLISDTQKYKQLFRMWNLLSGTQIKEVVVQKCREVLKNDQETRKQANAITILSFLVDSESFARLIEPFQPETDKIDPADDKTEKMLPLIKTSAMCLKNVNPWNDYSSVAKFCKGDYLKYVLGSLMSVCYNTNQRKIVPFLETLTDSPVSVKKHAVRLSFNIVSKPQLMSLLSNLWNRDKNPATREVLLALVWRAFIDVSADFFALLKHCLKSLTTEDKNLFDKLSNSFPIPDAYKAEYIQLCWDKLHDLPQQGAKSEYRISQLVSQSSDSVELLPPSFCERVLKQYLSDGSPLKSVSVMLAVQYALRSSSDIVLNERLNLVSDLFKDLLEHSASGWEDVEWFVCHLVNCVLFDKYRNSLQVLQKTLSFWPSVFNPVHKFESFMLLNFANLYFIYKPEFDLVSFGRVSSDCVFSVLEEYGPEAVTLVSETFESFVEQLGNSCYEDCEELEIRLKVITGLLTEPVQRHAYIMAAHLIPENFTKNRAFKDQYILIIHKLFKVEDKTVSLSINSLLVFEQNLSLLDSLMQV
ncbi:uncharacterized protein LOC134536986 isoform X1 [Bacillus rossius redtenbacheri]|uniref:uncharacterized protein LOC134536986 isoform X1 n=1 Tax=Bacillus rossius redtenbacheri TaxID=93214 RepID=UPI002FDDEBA1